MKASRGRLQGESCRKPSQQNEHGKRCTLLRKIAGFSHADEVGFNSL
ncbi:MAG TPA: hypothetical protein VH081_03505 [Solirubrobacteraceae bacterium]|nr:hypothetical protein [Solirubrobacteraceae bacterium]